MFVSTDDGEIPLSSIRTAVRRRDAVTLVYGDDEETRATLASWDQALRDTPQQVFPAESGTYLLHAAVEKGVFAVSRSKVLAWCISADRILYPISTEGVNGSERDTPPVLHPDGTVDVYGDHTYDIYQFWAEAAEAGLLLKPRERLIA
ncbi:MAG: hypothetical protein E6G94_02115 [Alphaproteobacteria bacterium]|nr:MAG: hypothetical protein E6G94_02115 [Alphaproteobacteria bacterium]